MTSIAVGAISVGTAAMLIILSVFSGFVNASKDNVSQLYPDIQVLAKRGKLLPHPDKVLKILESDSQVQGLSKTIDEKVYLIFRDNQDIAYLKGVDENYNTVYPIEDQIYFGRNINNKEDEIIASDSLTRRMLLNFDGISTARIFGLKPGKGRLNDKKDLREVKVLPVGVFFIPDEKYHRHIFSSLATAQKFLNLKDNACYSIEINLKKKIDNDEFKVKLIQRLGGNYNILTREDQDAAYLKMLNLENAVVYLILSLVVFVLSFSLIGVIFIIVLNKLQTSKTLWSMGFQKNKIKQIYFFVGLIITVSAILIGVLIGTSISLTQYITGVFAPNGLPFPISFEWFNFLSVIVTVLVMGVLVSYSFSRRIGL